MGEDWGLDVEGARVVRASSADLETAIDILEDAFGWASSLGVRSYPPGSFRRTGSRPRAHVQEALEAGGLYLVLVGQEAAATASLFEEDERFWPGTSRDALYVHKLAVRRRFAGMGFGSAILRWAEGQAVERGKRFVRLDTSADNADLLAYYERAGFVRRGDVTDGSFPVARFERALDERPATMV